jgi:hypothetical protein
VSHRPIAVAITESKKLCRIIQVPSKRISSKKCLKIKVLCVSRQRGFQVLTTGIDQTSLPGFDTLYNRRLAQRFHRNVITPSSG